jgi:hypothetical protein
MPDRAAVVLIICMLAGCGGSSPDKRGGGPDRLGCHQYCRQTGGFGAPPTSPPPIAVVANRGPVKVVDRLIPVTVQCRFPRACNGAIVVTLDTTELGRSDLAVAAKASREIGVELSPAGRKGLSGRGPVKVLVTLDTGPSWMTLSVAERPHWGAVQPGEITVSSP